MLSNLRLKNFKVFKDQEIEFHEGTTAVVGPNGSGKTTILEAIEFALFKRVTRKEKTLKSAEDLIRHGDKKSKVELEFIAPINRRNYRVVRQIMIGKTTAELFEGKNREPVASGVTRVDEEIEKLLGLDRHAFSALTYVRQGEIDRLSRLTPSKRKTDLLRMMGFGVYDDVSSDVGKEIREIKKDLGIIEESRKRLEGMQKHLPSLEEVERALETLQQIESLKEIDIDVKSIRLILEKVNTSLQEIRSELNAPDLSDRPRELDKRSKIAEVLKRIIDNIPGIAEDQLRPHIRREAREIFRSIFGDRYSDLLVDDNYDVTLYDLQGNKVSLMAASGGEDVCVNFALRVAVNTALQKHSVSTPPPNLIILDEPGAGLDSQRRRWLPDAIRGLKSVNQILVVTHMQELKDATSQVISLTPQGKGRQPIVETEHE
jgi:DNA repair exonuclease SbcCD ATPase subunit